MLPKANYAWRPKPRATTQPLGAAWASPICGWHGPHRSSWPRHKGLCPTLAFLTRPCRREVGNSLVACPIRPGPPPVGSSTLHSHIPETHGTSVSSSRAHQPSQHLTPGGFGRASLHWAYTLLTGRGGSFPVFRINTKNTGITSLENLSI